MVAPHSLFVEQHTQDCLLSNIFSMDVEVFSMDIKAFSMDVKAFSVHIMAFSMDVKVFSLGVMVFSMDVNCSVVCLNLLVFLFVIKCEIKFHCLCLTLSVCS